MKAVRIHRYGGPDELTYEDAPVPEPGAGQLLVRVRAAAINCVDWKIREGYLQCCLPHQLPLIPGWDFSGIVEAVGPGTHSMRGEEVYGCPDLSRDGCYAEFTVVREAATARKPQSIDHVHAAAIPHAAYTAWHSLFDSAGLVRGQEVFIHDAAGGIGHMAVQLAKAKGARVIAATSARNLTFVRELGADQVVDYRAQRFEEVVHDVDVVLDTLGGEVQRRSWMVLKPGGVLVSVATPHTQEMTGRHVAPGSLTFNQPNTAQLTELAHLTDGGRLRPLVETILPLADARRAHLLSQGGHTRGKIVLLIP